MQLPVLFELKRELIELADLITASVLRSVKPLDDDISTRQAYSEFGKEWIQYHTRRKNIESIRKGPHKNSRRVFSRMELMALKESERRIVSIIKESNLK